MKSLRRRSASHPGGLGPILVIAAACLVSASCARPPLRIGYLGPLTGRLSDLGVSGRNGAVSAVEERNGRGGIRGRKVELVSEDDIQDPVAAADAFDRLRKAGVAAVVGPMTSDIALAVLDAAGEAEIPLVSPTASTPKLSGLDDYFLRVNPPDLSEAVSLAGFAAEAGFGKVAAVYDLANRSFSERLAQEFSKTFLRSGGRTTLLPFDSSTSPSYSSLARRILEESPEALLIIAGTADTAALAQQLSRAGYAGTLYGTGWAMTSELVRNGGNAVEGMVFSHYFDQESGDPRWTAFAESYRTRFGSVPDFVAGLGYIAARVILDSMEAAGTRDVRGSILRISRFEGLQGTVTLDRYGDAELERFRIVLRNGRFRITVP